MLTWLSCACAPAAANSAATTASVVFMVCFLR
jgi:hypothetical protein